MKGFIKQYGFLVSVLVLNVCLLIWLPRTGADALVFTGKSALTFLINLPPVFVCIGLLDVWVERESMIRIMGERSGIRGVAVSFLLGTVTALPLYALLPVAGMLVRKGSRIMNVLVFLCTSVSVRIPLLLFEISSLGFAFTAVRCAANIGSLLLTAFLIDRILTGQDRERIYLANIEG